VWVSRAGGGAPQPAHDVPVHRLPARKSRQPGADHRRGRRAGARTRGCCNPLPGEEVVGFITRGRGITVHRADCTQLDTMDQDRRISVDWDKGSEVRHSGMIEIFCLDRPGMLAHITKLCEQQQVNISSAQARSMSDDRANVSLELSVRDVAELTRLIRNIEKIKGVSIASRGRKRHAWWKARVEPLGGGDVVGVVGLWRARRHSSGVRRRDPRSPAAGSRRTSTAARAAGDDLGADLRGAGHP
jgi:predicted amino acid-binding ACT domain protein